MNKNTLDQRIFGFNNFEYDTRCAMMISSNDLKGKVRKWK